MDRSKHANNIKYIVDNLNNTDYFVARLVYLLYSDKYCMTNDDGKDKWFVFNDNHWRTSASIKHDLKNKLSEEVTQFISDARLKIKNDALNVTEDHSFIERRIINLIKIEKSLYNTTYKDRILKECESHFFVNELPNH